MTTHKMTINKAWVPTLVELATRRSDMNTRKEGLIPRLIDPMRCDATCALLRLEAADEVDRLRLLAMAWKAAAEAYELGALGEGDRLVVEARRVAQYNNEEDN